MAVSCCKPIACLTALHPAAACLHHCTLLRWPLQYALVGAMDIAFAFGGQINWMRWVPAAVGAARACQPAQLLAHARPAVPRVAASAQLLPARRLTLTFAAPPPLRSYITTTRERHKFATAVSLTTGFMSVVYVFISVAGYSVLGSDTDVHQ